MRRRATRLFRLQSTSSPPTFCLFVCTDAACILSSDHWPPNSVGYGGSCAKQERLQLRKRGTHDFEFGFQHFFLMTRRLPLPVYLRHRTHCLPPRSLTCCVIYSVRPSLPSLCCIPSIYLETLGSLPTSPPSGLIVSQLHGQHSYLIHCS